MRPAIRHIQLPHLYNLRDSGGYETSDGTSTAWHRLYRSDCPENLSDSEWDRLAGLGIATLIDVRSTYEASESPVCAPKGFTYRHCPFFYEEPGIELVGDAGREFLASLSLDYRVMTETSAMQIAKILTAICEGMTNGAVMFFCTAGKDRTGIVAAEVLRLCGVSDQCIVSDYCVTEVYNAEVIRQRIESLPPEILEQVSPQTMAVAADSSPDTMRRYLAWSEEWGFCTQMNGLGFSTEAQRELKFLLTDLGSCDKCTEHTMPSQNEV